MLFRIQSWSFYLQFLQNNEVCCFSDIFKKTNFRIFSRIVNSTTVPEPTPSICSERCKTSKVIKQFTKDDMLNQYKNIKIDKRTSIKKKILTTSHLGYIFYHHKNLSYSTQLKFTKSTYKRSFRCNYVRKYIFSGSVYEAGKFLDVVMCGLITGGWKMDGHALRISYIYGGNPVTVLFDDDCSSEILPFTRNTSTKQINDQ
ncbi:hypothetical protein AGLY_012675 [Aphis glycines]|uniref:Uncharacterized protein n=1 Tax=Aphis glycines TaxID=307491 RepID=A0A6G0T9L9_APHGL|nr:hypothetical protein AGLY_012675 [Aphis glycines]